MGRMLFLLPILLCSVAIAGETVSYRKDANGLLEKTTQKSVDETQIEKYSLAGLYAQKDVVLRRKSEAIARYDAELADIETMILKAIELEVASIENLSPMEADIEYAKELINGGTTNVVAKNEK